jgi:hypothetical protein
LHLWLLPDPVQTISRAIYEPGDVYVWVAFLFDEVVVLYHVLSPKLQFHLLRVTPVVVSKNFTPSGAGPLVAFIVKLAMLALIVFVGAVVLHPAALQAISLVIYVPADEYVCAGLFCDESVVLNHVPSPKLQFHDVGLMVD